MEKMKINSRLNYQSPSIDMVDINLTAIICQSVGTTTVADPFVENTEVIW